MNLDEYKIKLWTYSKDELINECVKLWIDLQGEKESHNIETLGELECGDEYWNTQQ